MKTLREAGFKAARVATNGTMKLSLGTLGNGMVVVVAHTPKGEGYTTYRTAGEAIATYDNIVERAGLITL